MACTDAEASTRAAVRSRRAVHAIALASFTALSLNCATGQSVLGTGDISFRLVWTGPADLDLFVWDPAGERINYDHRTSASGGLLDQDCNATPQTNCAAPVENVFWPSGRAPSGTYKYGVRFTNIHLAQVPVPFTVLVLHGRKVVETRQGTLMTFNEFWGPFDATWKH